MNYPKWMKSLLDLKVTWLMYTAGGLFILLLLDLLVWHAGAFPTRFLWQLILLAGLLAGTQHAFFLNRERPGAKRVALHVAVNFAVVLTLLRLFGWVPPLTPMVLLCFSGTFAVIYAGVYFGFSVYYSVMRGKLNDQLEKYKQS